MNTYGVFERIVKRDGKKEKSIISKFICETYRWELNGNLLCVGTVACRFTLKCGIERKKTETKSN